MLKLFFKSEILETFITHNYRHVESHIIVLNFFFNLTCILHFTGNKYSNFFLIVFYLYFYFLLQI